MSPAAGNSANDSPVPPRYWWLRRIGMAVLLYALAIAGLRLYVGMSASRQYEALLAEARARGLRPTTREYAPRAMPDEENAVSHFQRAAARIVQKVPYTEKEAARFPPGTRPLWDLPGDFAEIERSRGLVERLLWANAGAFQEIDQMLGRKAYEWGAGPASPVASTLLPQLSPYQAIVRLLALRSYLSYLEGDDAAVIAGIRGAIDLSAGLTSIEPCFAICFLTANAGYGLALDTIESVLPRLSIEGTAAAGREPARRADVERLIATLSDESVFTRGMRAVIEAELLTQVDNCEVLVRGNPTFVPFAMPGVRPRVISWLFGRSAWKLIAVRNGRELLDLESRVCSAGPSAAVVRPVGTAPPAPWFDLIRAAQQELSPQLGGWMPRIRAHLARRRMAAVGLAIRLFELDHGRKPGELSELVPEYLAAIPSDPLSADGRALGYRPRAVRPYLYSVGDNGIDQDGNYAVYPDGNVNWRTYDMPFFLDGAARVAPTSAAGTP